jgi:hypothetical protein
VYDSLQQKCLAIKCVDLRNEEPTVCDAYENEIKLLQKLQKYSCIIRLYDLLVSTVSPFCIS